MQAGLTVLTNALDRQWLGQDASCCSKNSLQWSLLEDIVVVAGALVVLKAADEGLHTKNTR